jgi:hypothetical protein
MASKPYPRNLKPSGQIKNIKGDQKRWKEEIGKYFCSLFARGVTIS